MKVKGGQEARYRSDHVRARTGGEKGINNDDSDIEDDDDDPLPPVLVTTVALEVARPNIVRQAVF